MEIFTSFCNTCYKENVDLNDICSTTGNMMLMKNIIEACFHNMDLQRHVPLYLCTDCCNKIIEMSRLQEICVKNLICLKKHCLRKKELLEKEHVNEEYIQSVLKNIIKGRKNYTLKYLHEISTVDTLCKNIGRTSLTLNEHSLSQTDMESDDASVISTIPSSAIYSRTPSPNTVGEIFHRIEEQIRKSQEVKDEIKEENIESEDLQADENDMHVFVDNGLTTTITSNPRIARSPKDGNEIVNSLTEDLPTYRREIQNKIKEENDKDSLCVQMDEDDMGVFIDDDMDISVDEDDKEVESIILSKERMDVTKSINNRGGSGSCIVKVPENEHLNMHDNEIITTARKKDLAEQKIDQNVHMNQDNVEASTNVYETEVETSPNESSEPNHFQKTKMLSKITNLPNIFLLHKCNECGICLHTASELFAHKRTHNSESPRRGYICFICKIGFSKQLQLDKHRNRQHKRMFQCAICEQVFNSKRNLIFHMKLHTDGVDKNDGFLYKCKYCAKLFAVKNLYINHLKRIHQRVESVQVDGKTVCSSDESRTESLPASPSSELRRQHICRHCNKHFPRPSDLTRHTRVHNGERPFQCNICQKRFTQRGSLNRHVQRHAGNKPHVCSVCDKAFVTKAHMIIHIRTHTGRRPYKCTECPKAFTQQSHLVRHRRTHTGVKPYVCPECNAAFTDSGDLTRHIRTHTGEKPYQCAICCSSFTQAHNLTKHKRIHNEN